MADDDWYRSEDWSDSIEAKFFEKLSRARSQRDQYLAIKIGCLTFKHPKESLRLSHIYFDTRKNEFHDLSVFFCNAKAYQYLNNVEEELEMLSRASEIEAKGSQDTGARIEYAFRVATKKRRQHFDNAKRYLGQIINDQELFPERIFKKHTAASFLNKKSSSKEDYIHSVSIALEASSLTDNGIPELAGVGVLDKNAHKWTIIRLKLSKWKFHFVDN
jgi:hypothetical protein